LENSVESIIEAIRSAFAGVPRGSITIHEADLIEDYDSDEEWREAREADNEASWDQVPDQDIEECSTALSQLDHASWRYYLPAYMIRSLRNFREDDSGVSDYTIYTFNPHEKIDALRDYQLERFRFLNQAQSLAVCRFLRYMTAHGDFVDAGQAHLALDKYWGKFSESTVESADVKHQAIDNDNPSASSV
jgi:hypothetical protein